MEITMQKLDIDYLNRDEDYTTCEYFVSRDSEILTGDWPECSSDFESQVEDEESITGLIEEERNYVHGIEYFQRFHSQLLDTSAKEKSVEWILKVIDIT
ncbi:hypothetical protein LguiB_022630 [Lonicera macranthoides]